MHHLTLFVHSNLQNSDSFELFLIQKLAVALAIVALLVFVGQGVKVDPRKSLK